MLEVRHLSFSYGRVQALDDVSLTVAEGEVVTILGANGAGKTTLLHAIAGVHPPGSGSVWLDGVDVSGVEAERMVARGVSLVPEGRHIFPQQSVTVNLTLGAFHRRGVSREDLARDLEVVYRMFPVLRQRARQLAGTLSGGEQQMLAIGRALMAHPRLLLLDEPSMGLAPLLVEEIFGVLGELVQQGLTILLVEQNAHIALELAHRGHVLQGGRIALEGTAAWLRDNDQVRTLYLGEEAASAASAGGGPGG